jgi:predicted enzyme related to lactoylglutathione lyase
VSWFEISTDDGSRSQAFWSEMFGWKTTPDEHDGDSYQIISTGDGHPIGGGLRTAGQPKHAVFFVMVQDVEATAAKVTAAGGGVRTPPASMTDGLRYAYLTDPDGNLFGIFTPTMAELSAAEGEPAT